MKKLLIFALALGAVYACVTSRRRPKFTPDQSELDQWEAEGGSIPVDGQRTAAQTRAAPASSG
jgi:hypothetical protein